MEPINPSDFLATPAVEDWRLLSDGANAFFATASLAESVRLLEAIAAIPGIDEHPPAVDVRADGVTVRTVTFEPGFDGLSSRDLEVARAVSSAARALGCVADPSRLQSLLVIPGAPGGTDVLPFWRAALDYDQRPDSPDEDLVDPRGRSTPFWFERMKEARGGGGAIHLAVWLPPEQARARVDAALAAGGHIVRDDFAPSWWTLADAAGNEVDISSIEGRM